VLYHVVDEFSAFSDASEHVAALERRLLARADLVIVSSERLLEAKQAVNPRCVLVRHGVDLAHFSRALDPSLALPPELVALPKPVIGFFGLVADWIDLELVRKVADAWPHGSVVLLGKVISSTAALDGARNVHLIGRRPYAELPAWCRGFDVALTPFRRNELALAANPLKAREYVAAGLPNVCTDLPELRRVPGCAVARTHDEFLAEVRRALADPGPSPARTALVRAEGWEDLLHDWLSCLLHSFLQDGFIAATITVEELDSTHLRARLVGEKLDYKRHNFETEIKAVTYHQLSVTCENGRWQARVIFDV